MAVPYNVSSFGRFGGGLTIGQRATDQPVGTQIWVDSNSPGNYGTFKEPYVSVEGALNSGLTANKGTEIHIKPGHSEAWAAAAAATFDTAGVDFIGHGAAGAMPQFTFTAAASDVDITAASNRFFGCRFTAAFADVVSGFDVSANGLEFHQCRFDESGTDLNWLEVANCADGVDDFVMNNCYYLGGDASNNQLVTFAGTHENCKFYYNSFYHATAQTAATGFVKSVTQMLQMEIVGNYMHSEVAAIPNAFVELANATNTGFACYNMLSGVDTDAAAADVIEAFDVTGLMSFENNFAGGVADTHGSQLFTTVEDFT